MYFSLLGFCNTHECFTYERFVVLGHMIHSHGSLVACLSIAGNKEMARYYKKMGKETSTLTKLMKKYEEVNSVLPEANPYRMQEAMKIVNLLSGSFPWTDARATIHLQGKSMHTCRTHLLQ